MQRYKKHFEWSAFLAGLIALAFMDPATAGSSFCVFDLAGIEFCPGDGLGHSISYTFRGNLKSAFEANFAGPFAVIILSLRILQVWINLFQNHKQKNRDNNG